MTLLNRLQQTQPENLRMESDNRLESDTAILIYGKGRYGSDRPYIDLTDKNTGKDCHFIMGDNSLEWDFERSGQESIEIGMPHMNEALKSVKDLNIGFCGPLMQRAICAIALQHGKATENGKSLMVSALTSYGNFSISKDGKISDMKATQIQNQGGRS